MIVGCTCATNTIHEIPVVPAFTSSHEAPGRNQVATTVAFDHVADGPGVTVEPTAAWRPASVHRSWISAQRRRLRPQVEHPLAGRQQMTATAQKIIVGYDGSPDSQAAARWGLDEAARVGAAVEFCNAEPWPTVAMADVPGAWFDDEYEHAQQAMVGEAAAQAARTHPGVTIHQVIVHAPAALTLCERSADAGVVVLGSRGHNAAAGLLGSVSVAVSAHAQCPVVVVRGFPEPSQEPVVVGFDGSDTALAALAFAFVQAGARQTRLRVIQAWTTPVMHWTGPSIDVERLTAAAQVTLGKTVAGWRAKFPTVEVNCEVVVDQPAHALIEAAKGAQLIVVGSHGHGVLAGTLLGSVSQLVLHHSACSVAVVHDRRMP
ncbi:universal stress protein [Micromonosporaceae bacterium Da 78-11]